MRRPAGRSRLPRSPGPASPPNSSQPAGESTLPVRPGSGSPARSRAGRCARGTRRSESPQFVAIGGADDREVSPDGGVSRLAEGMPQRRHVHSIALRVAVGERLRPGMPPQCGTSVTVDGSQCISMILAPESLRPHELRIPREKRSIRQDTNDNIGAHRQPEHSLEGLHPTRHHPCISTSPAQCRGPAEIALQIEDRYPASFGVVSDQ